MPGRYSVPRYDPVFALPRDVVSDLGHPASRSVRNAKKKKKPAKVPTATESQQDLFDHVSKRSPALF
jgi:hypothetical protein